MCSQTPSSNLKQYVMYCTYVELIRKGMTGKYEIREQKIEDKIRKELIIELKI
jgi:hypothetical protein